MREGRWSSVGDVAAVCLIVAALATLVTLALVGGGHDEAAGLVGAGSFAALAVVLSARHVRERGRARARKVTADALAALESVMEPAISSLPAADLLGEVLLRTKEAVHAEAAWILVRGTDHHELEVRSSAAPVELGASGHVLSPGRGVLHALSRAGRAPVVLDDAARHELSPSRAVDLLLGPLAACPLLVDGRLLGALVVGASRSSTFGTTELRVLGVAAERIAEVLERSRLDEAERRSRLGSEQAHLHLRVLARAGAVLGTALESIDPALRAIGDTVVPDFADWFALDALDQDGALKRMTATWSASDATVTRSPTPSRAVPSPHPRGDQLLRLALAEMRPQLVVNTDRLGNEVLGVHVHDAGSLDATALEGAAVDSVLVVPLRVSETFAGAMTFVRFAGRRGYRPSDVEVAGELAERVAVAIDRVAALRESRRAAETATRDAARLGRLVEAALVVNAQLTEAGVLDVLVEHAQRVLGAAAVAVASPSDEGVAIIAECPRASSASAGASRRDVRRHAAIRRAGRAVLDSSRPTRRSGPAGEGWIAVPLVDPEGTTLRAVVALAGDDAAIDDDDESVLTLLTQMAAVALQNARLYARASRNERRLQAVVQASPLAIAELRPTGALRWGNRATTDLFGSGGPFAPPSLVESRGGADDYGSRSFAIADAELPLAGLLERARNGASTVGLSISAERVDGERRELSISASPLVDDDRVSGVLFIAEDVTESRQMLERVHQSERLAATSRMAGALAHDFNNLLTVILGCSEVLSREVHDDAALHDVAAIRRAGGRAAELTSQLLRIGQGRPTQAEAVDVDDVLTSMRPMLASVLGPEVELTVGPREPEACVVLGRADLERAVLNLAINARDAMPRGGALHVDTTLTSDPGKRTTVEIAFSDTGAGMDADTAAHCLEPFFTTKSRGRGTGLGLATVHAMVTQAGGDVRVESEIGDGTCVTLSFPAHVVARRTGSAAARVRRSQHPERSRPAPRRTAPREVVLFVDDEAELVRLAGRTLEGAGYSVVTAHTGDEAFEIAVSREGEIDLLVTDAVMAGMNGGELAAAMARRFPQVPVLFTSGYLDADAPGRLSLPDDAAVLEKPYSSEELVLRVRCALDVARPAERQRGGRRSARNHGSKR